MTWANVDQETFALFADFVSTGDYSLHPSSDKYRDHTTLSLDDDEVEVPKVPVKFIESPGSNTQPRLVSCNDATIVRVRPTRIPSKDCSLLHARLYVHSDKNNITKLMALANLKLDIGLSECIPFQWPIRIKLWYHLDTYMTIPRPPHHKSPPPNCGYFIADQRSDMFTGSVMDDCGTSAQDLVSYLLEQRISSKAFRLFSFEGAPA